LPARGVWGGGSPPPAPPPPPPQHWPLWVCARMCPWLEVPRLVAEPRWSNSPWCHVQLGSNPGTQMCGPCKLYILPYISGHVTCLMSHPPDMAWRTPLEVSVPRRVYTFPLLSLCISSRPALSACTSLNGAWWGHETWIWSQNSEGLLER
jgi:hypothetical protein